MTTIILTPMLRALLLSQPGPQCAAAIANGRASIIVKTDPATIAGFRGPIPIGYRSELGLYEAGAVIRLVLDFYDHPNAPYGTDTFLNPAQPDDAKLLRKLAKQDILDIHLFDLDANYVFSKRINHREVSRRELTSMIEQATKHNTEIGRVDFPSAKAVMMQDQPM